MTEKNADQAERVAKQRLREKAESYYQNLEEAFFNILPGNQSPVETVFLAHLMTAADGYKDVVLVSDWTSRPSKGWQTVVVYLPELENGLTATFAFECRNDDHCRQLAILIDDYRPGERLPEKMQRERLLTSLNFRVMSFSEIEILADPTECRERIEGVLSDMVYELLVETGQITGKED